MIRKVHGANAKACCFSINLLLKEDGTKFGKSEGGALYLDPQITPIYSIYNYLVNAKDSDVEKFLKQLTFLSKGEIEHIMIENEKSKSLRLAQKSLAKAVISDLYGEKEALRCADISTALFSGKIAELDSSDLYFALSGCQTYICDKDETRVIDIVVDAGLCKNKTEARNIAEQGGLLLNNEQVKDSGTVVFKKNSFTYDKKAFAYIKKGKRDYLLILFK
jgi:tyrosyl-tRNA synthetase